MSVRYVVAVEDQKAVSYSDLVDFIYSPKAPAGVTAGHARAIACLYGNDDDDPVDPMTKNPAMKALADGAEVDAEALLTEATRELEWASAETFGAIALRTFIQWMLVSRRLQEIRTI